MKQTKFISFCTQKGGAGKTTFTVLAASYLHYTKGYNVVIVDCDFPQHSINRMRRREMEIVEQNIAYKELLYKNLTTLNKKPYPILTCASEKAIDTANSFLETEENKTDIVLFDFPGTVNSEGVINSLANIDYIFTPITADEISLESSLSFVSSMNTVLVKNKEIPLKEIFLFWNQVDKREKTDLYEKYEKTIKELDLLLLSTYIPDKKKFRKEGTEKDNLFRSTLFAPTTRQLRETNLTALINELITLIKL